MAPWASGTLTLTPTLAPAVPPSIPVLTSTATAFASDRWPPPAATAWELPAAPPPYHMIIIVIMLIIRIFNTECSKTSCYTFYLATMYLLKADAGEISFLL